MTKRFKSVDETVKGESYENFYLQWCIHTIQSVFRWVKLPSIVQDVCYMYQDKRFYLDEFPEQEQLRFEWLFKNSEWPLITIQPGIEWSDNKNCGTISCTMEDGLSYNVICRNVNGECIVEWESCIDEKDNNNFLSNRFLKRN